MRQIRELLHLHFEQGHRRFIPTRVGNAYSRAGGDQRRGSEKPGGVRVRLAAVSRLDLRGRFRLFGAAAVTVVAVGDLGLGDTATDRHRHHRDAADWHAWPGRRAHRGKTGRRCEENIMDPAVVGNVLSGLTLAAIIWIGRTLHDLVSTVRLHDWRITQLEKPTDEEHC